MFAFFDLDGFAFHGNLQKIIRTLSNFNHVSPERRDGFQLRKSTKRWRLTLYRDPVEDKRKHSTIDLDLKTRAPLGPN